MSGKQPRPIFARWWAELDLCLSGLDRAVSYYGQAKRHYEIGQTPQQAAKIIAANMPRHNHVTP